MSTDEYTPTTEHVRSGFCVSNGFPAMTRRERGLGFDRWLAERDRQVAEQTGERIAAALVLTDAEWREFQQIPDQGYSHRAWLDARAAAIARADSAAPAREPVHIKDPRLAALVRSVAKIAQNTPARPTTDDRDERLTDLAHAVAEAYLPAGQAIWWRSWATHPERRKAMEAGVLSGWSGEAAPTNPIDAPERHIASRPTTPTPTVSEDDGRCGACGSPINGFMQCAEDDPSLADDRTDMEQVRYTVQRHGTDEQRAALGVVVTTDGGEV